MLAKEPFPDSSYFRPASVQIAHTCLKAQTRNFVACEYFTSYSGVRSENRHTFFHLTSPEPSADAGRLLLKLIFTK